MIFTDISVVSGRFWKMAVSPHWSREVLCAWWLRVRHYLVMANVRFATSKPARGKGIVADPNSIFKAECRWWILI